MRHKASGLLDPCHVINLPSFISRKVDGVKTGFLVPSGLGGAGSTVLGGFPKAMVESKVWVVYFLLEER